MDTLSLVELVVAILLPAAVGLVTKEVTNSSVKAVALAALSALAGIGTAYVNNKGILTEETVMESVRYFAIAVVSYFGFLKPTGVTGKIQEKTSSFGV